MSEPSILHVHAPLVVVADDERVTRDRLCELMRSRGYDVEPAVDGQDAVEFVAKGSADIVLMDVLMPRLGGIEACRIIKGLGLERFVPVILVSARADTASRIEGLRIGADDYVTKPFDEPELVARVEAMLRIKRLNDQLVSVRQKLERLSVVDEATGLYNYRYLHTRLREEFKRAERHHEPLACLVVDMDRPTAQTAEQGGSLSRTTLRALAEGIRRCVREVDVLARYGPQEFLLILPCTHLAGSVVVAERIWREVREHTYPTDDARQGVRVAATIGVAVYPSPEIRTKEALLRSLDAAIGRARREGGDRVCVHQPAGQAGP